MIIIKRGLRKIPEVRVPEDQFISRLISWSFASHSECSTIAWGTSRWKKFVDEVGSTVFHHNVCCVSATRRAITKADYSLNFTIFHCRMNTFQSAWPVCTTSVGWHARCWHFFPAAPAKRYHPLESSLSHKTGPDWWILFRLASLRFL